MYFRCVPSSRRSELFGGLTLQTARFKRKTKIAQFRVFELSMEGPHSHRTFRQPFDLLAITNTTWERKKAAGADSSDLRPIWLPTVDNLRCAKQSLVFLIGCKSQ